MVTTQNLEARLSASGGRNIDLHQKVAALETQLKEIRDLAGPPLNDPAWMAIDAIRRTLDRQKT